MRRVYLRIWAYDVPAHRTDAFVAAYGPEGDWAQLFRRSGEYVGTELFRDVESAQLFITVDRWRHEGAWKSFLVQHGEDYAALGSQLEGVGGGGRPLLEGPSRSGPEG